jgi:hypothetical protein
MLSNFDRSRERLQKPQSVGVGQAQPILSQSKSAADIGRLMHHINRLPKLHPELFSNPHSELSFESDRTTAELPNLVP